MMKMKEILEKTGLTERAVRLYVQRGLVTPKAVWKNGRDYLEFSCTDLQRLREIGLLRRMGFSLEQIAQMIRVPQHIPGLLQAHLRQLRESSREVAQAAQLLEPLQEGSYSSLTEFVQRLSQAQFQRELPLRELELRFGEQDGLGEEERQQQEQNSQEQLALQQVRKAKRNWVLAGIGMGLVLLMMIGGVFWYHFTQRGISQSRMLTGVWIEDKYADWEGHEDAPYVALVQVGQIDGSTRTMRLRIHKEDWQLYSGLVWEMRYESCTVELFVPNWKLRKLRDKLGNLSDQMLFDQILQDDALLEEYVRFTRVQPQAYASGNGVHSGHSY